LPSGPATESAKKGIAMLDESVIESIRELEVDGATGLLNMLATAFVEDVTARLAQLRVAVAEGASVRINEATHSLKGMCGAIGALEMSAMTLELEQPGQTTDAQRAMVEALESEFGRVQAALARALAMPHAPHAS
jgi:HPt (histidine-containing phosphotransfer) domain-containing protein